MTQHYICAVCDILLIEIHMGGVGGNSSIRTSDSSKWQQQTPSACCGSVLTQMLLAADTVTNPKTALTKQPHQTGCNREACVTISKLYRMHCQHASTNTFRANLTCKYELQSRLTKSAGTAAK